MVSQPFQNGANGLFGQPPYGIYTGGAAPGSYFSVSQNIVNQQNTYAAPSPPVMLPPAPPPCMMAPPIQQQPCMTQPAPAPQIWMQSPQQVIIQSPYQQQPMMSQPVFQQPLAMSTPISSYQPYAPCCPQPMYQNSGGLAPLVGMIMQMMTRMMSMFSSGGASGLPNTAYTDPLTGQQVPSSLNAGALDDLNGSGRIWGDPHFVDPDGGKFDVMGEVGKTYNILSDKGLQFNAEFGVWKNFDGKDGRELKTIISRAGLTAGDSQVAFDVNKKLTINGKQVSDGDYDLGGGARASLKDGKLNLSTSEYDVTLSSNGEYLDHDIKATNAGADGVAPHGLWGQLVDGDGKARNGDEGGGAQGGGAIDTAQRDPNTGKFVRSEKGDKETYKQYETNGLFDTAFASPFNRFQSAR